MKLVPETRLELVRPNGQGCLRPPLSPNSNIQAGIYYNPSLASVIVYEVITKLWLDMDGFVIDIIDYRFQL